MSDHADFIRTTRAMAQVTNLSPNQIRTNLRRFVNDQTAAQIRAAQQPEGTVPVSKNLGPPTDPGMNLGPSAFTPVAVAQGLPPNIPSPLLPGTTASSYEMGTNRTTTDPTAADDTWTRAGGPVPAGGGPYDSVVSTNPRAYVSGTTCTLYFRRIQYDSNGAISAIGAELAQTLP